MLIVLDPGHGGKDPGAVSGSLVEKAINWRMANILKNILEGFNAEVVIVQPSTENPSSTGKDELYSPPAKANELEADFYLSLHVNAGGGNGFESFVHPDTRGGEDDKIRCAIHYQVMQYLKDYGIRDRGKKYADFAVLRLTKMPAVLLENLFIDNGTDAGYLSDPLFLWGLMLATARGLVRAFNLKPV
jgi:N-acetylmuramoyl-L-alanine amidase